MWVMCGTVANTFWFGKLYSDFETLIEQVSSQSGVVAVRLEQAQMLMGIAPSSKGWVDMAAKGPSDLCRVTPPVKRAIISGVREIVECSELAVQKWHSQPWGTPPQVAMPQMQMVS